MERMLADASTVLAAVNAPPLLRMQAAFDLLDKLANLMGGDEDRNFKRLLRQRDAMPCLDRAFDRLPVRLRPRFKQGPVRATSASTTR